MDDKDLTYNSLLDKLTKAEPVLSDADALTSSIMQQIEQTEPGHKQSRVIYISAIMSGIAASILIAFGVYETIRYPVYESEPQIIYTVQDPALNIWVIEKIRPDNKAKREKQIINEYIKYQQEQHIQRKHRYAAFINKHQ